MIYWADHSTEQEGKDNSSSVYYHPHRILWHAGRQWIPWSEIPDKRELKPVPVSLIVKKETEEEKKKFWKIFLGHGLGELMSTKCP